MKPRRIVILISLSLSFYQLFAQDTFKTLTDKSMDKFLATVEEIALLEEKLLESSLSLDEKNEELVKIEVLYNDLNLRYTKLVTEKDKISADLDKYKSDLTVSRKRVNELSSQKQVLEGLVNEIENTAKSKIRRLIKQIDDNYSHEKTARNLLLTAANKIYFDKVDPTVFIEIEKPKVINYQLIYYPLSFEKEDLHRNKKIIAEISIKELSNPREYITYEVSLWERRDKDSGITYYKSHSKASSDISNWFNRRSKYKIKIKIRDFEFETRSFKIK